MDNKTFQRLQRQAKQLVEAEKQKPLKLSAAEIKKILINKYGSVTKAAEAIGVSFNLLYRRINKGFTNKDKDMLTRLGINVY